MSLPDSRSPPADSLPDHRGAGFGYGLLGVVSFSVTLPATRLAVAALDPVFVGLGRAVVAGVLAAMVLIVTRTRWPGWRYAPGLALVAAGVVIGFPLCSAWAMQRVPANHGAVVIGLLPLATAVAAAVLAHERPTPLFWVTAVAGTAVVVVFAVYQGGGSVHAADLLLLAAVVAAAVGYAEGGRLAKLIGSWQVICWALVLSAPVLLVPVALSIDHRVATAPASAWAGFAYVCGVSMFIGFFAWYRGLALGGIAAVGQLQLLQPFLTVFFSALLLGESVDLATGVACTLVIATIAVGRVANAPRRQG